jgi:hypothetical protein
MLQLSLIFGALLKIKINQRKVLQDRSLQKFIKKHVNE